MYIVNPVRVMNPDPGAKRDRPGTVSPGTINPGKPSASPVTTVPGCLLGTQTPKSVPIRGPFDENKRIQGGLVETVSLTQKPKPKP